MITGWWQTDSRLALNEQEFSCGVLDSLYLMPDEYTPDRVNYLVLRSIVAKLLDAECTILSWASWLGSLKSSESVVAFPLHFSRKVYDKTYICAPNEKEILKGSLSNIGGFHFMVGDGHSNVAWDSMNRPDIVAKYWQFVEKVIVTIG